MKVTWRGFFKFVLLCLTIAALIYLMYTLFPHIKAAAATISFMPIIIKSAVVTCAVAGTAAVLFVFGMVCAAIYVLVKSSEVTNTDVNEQKVTLDDVIVSDEIKKELRMICNDILPEKKAMLKKVGFEPPRGYLLYGPPGNGKTLLARAVAGEANARFISVSGSELIGKYAGQGIYHVQDLFKKASEKTPCIIFIDEIDSVGTKRNSSRQDKEYYSKTLNQLLIEMDGFNSDKGVTVIAATNRREVLDEALLRPGRFSKHIYISLPDLSSREKILNLYMKNVKSDLNLKEIAEKTEDYSGAELSYLVNEAKHNAVKRIQGQEIEKLTITMVDFTNALNKSELQKSKNKNEKPNNIGNIMSLLERVVLNTLQQNCANSVGA